MHEMILSGSTSQKGSPALAQSLAKLLASTVVLKFTAHGFHWNVKGKDFPQFHDFFGEIYEDLESSIDPTAENILKLGYDAPYMLSDFLELSCIEPCERISDGDHHKMLQRLHADNHKLFKEANEAFKIANDCNEQGIADFLAGRIDMLGKWQWQLRATLNIQ
jgi:starvation-inducible DNA-binding protein